MNVRRLVIAILALTAIACGSRGDPRPPLRLLPPEPPQLTVAQRGTEAVIRFELMSPTVTSTDGELVDVDRVEILRMDQRYPALTSQVLLLGLDRERRERRDAAREAVTTAEESALRRQRDAELAAAIAAAVAAGEDPPEMEPDVDPAADDPETDAEDVEPLTEEELALSRVPSTVRSAWREAEVFPGTILEAAQDLEIAVDDLWTYLGMPTAIVDVDRTPRLPDPVVVLDGSQIVAASRDYDKEVERGTFRDFAEVVAAIPMSEIHEYVQGGLVQFTLPLDPPSTDGIRTRHFFAVRAVTTRDRESEIGRIVTLAPVPVPEPPVSLVAETLIEGLQLTWEPPATDVVGATVDPDDLEYTVYRTPMGSPGGPELLTLVALDEPEYLDTTLAWNSVYVYEVRAARRVPSLIDESTAPIGPPVLIPAEGEIVPPPETMVGVRKESLAAASPELRIEDIFAPSGVFNLTGVRAGTRVTLRWDPGFETDLRGYRVYKHAAPPPGIPGPAPGLVYPDLIQTDDTDSEDPDADTRAGRRQLRNRLADAGWEMITPVPITEARFIDPLVDAEQVWVYVVEAVDTSGNASLPASTIVSTEEGS